MTARTCPPRDLLVALSAGTAPIAVSVLMRAHAELCPRCGPAATQLDQLGMALARELPPSGLSDHFVEGLLDRAAATPQSPEASPLPQLPRSVLPYLARPFAFRRVIPGLEVADLPVRLGQEPVRLVRMRPGFVVPPHQHRGVELQLVLSGGLIESDTDYRRGDVQVGRDGAQHGFATAADEPCLTLLVKEAPLVQTTWTAALFTWWTGI